MAVEIVDVLEVVDVNEAERERLTAPFRFADPLAQDGLVGAVIAKPGQVVGERVTRGNVRAERTPLVERQREKRTRQKDEQPLVHHPEVGCERGEEDHGPNQRQSQPGASQRRPEQEQPS
jgi:hypothetical protein